MIIIVLREGQFVEIFRDEKVQIKGLSNELLERQNNYFKSKMSNWLIMLTILRKLSLYMGIFFAGIAFIMTYVNFETSNLIIGIVMLLMTFDMLTLKKIRLKKNDIRKSYINKHPDNYLKFSYFSVVDLNNYKTHINHLAIVNILLSIVCFLISII